MSHDTTLTIFVAVAAVAMLLQLATLVVLALSITKSTARLEAMAQDFQHKIDPLLVAARDIATDTSPKVKEITSNLLDVSASLRLQTERLDGAVHHVLSEVVTQVNHASHIVDETLNAAEKTRTSVEKPVRTASALLQAVGVGLSVLFGRNKREDDIRGEGRKDEMFI